MKYVVVETTDTGYATILFDDSIAHNEMAAVVPGFIKVHSAGFIKLTKKDEKYDIECYGQSVSLNIKSEPEFDTYLVKACLKRNFLLLDEPKPVEG